LRGALRLVKAGAANPEPVMVAILTISIFLVVIGALNVFEFGRVD
jgi:hypothetical protein